MRESDGDMAMDGVPRKAGAPLRKGTRDLYVGNIAVNYPRPGMEVSQIFDPATGLYSDWDGVEAVYDHLFYQALDVDPKDRPLLLCEPSCNTGEGLAMPGRGCVADRGWGIERRMFIVRTVALRIGNAMGIRLIPYISGTMRRRGTRAPGPVDV